jgi:hypothetical protein
MDLPSIAMVISPDGCQLVTGSDDSTVLGVVYVVWCHSMSLQDPFTCSLPCMVEELKGIHLWLQKWHASISGYHRGMWL